MLITSCGLKVLQFLGQRWSRSLGLCPDIILLCGWMWWGSFTPEIGFGSYKLILVVFSAEMKKNPTTICFLLATRSTSLLWWMTKSWLRINKRMSTINIAIWGLHYTGNNTVGRMRRVSLGILICLIWEEQNKRIFYNTCNFVSFFFVNSRLCSSWFCISMKKTILISNLGAAFLL